MTVIASASTPERLEYMRSLGADYVFNYKTEGYDKPLREAPDFDIVWVGAFYVLRRLIS